MREPRIGRQHLPWWVYQQASPKRFEKFYKFAFVRNPFDRALSGYSYLKVGGNQMEDIAIAEYLCKYNSFDEFVVGELLNGSMIYHPIFRPQSWYLCDWKGVIKVNYWGKFETIGVDFENVAQALCLKNFNGLPIVNKSPKKVDKIGSKSKSIIADLYKEDFKYFGY